RETRFGGAQSVAVAQSGDHVFVVTGGADDGVSLFKLLPNGRLVHLETLPHNTGGGLMNVSDIAATITGDTLQIFVSSQNSGGVAQYLVSVANLGTTATTTGTAGDDILIATTGSATLSGGAGNDILVSTDRDVILTGGNGADIFVISEAHSTTRITDFEDGQDRIDMSGFFFLRSPDQLNVSPISNGALIRFRDSEIHVTARNGASLDSLAIFGAEFDHPDHLLLPVEVTPDADGRIIGTSGADTLIGTDDSDTITGGGADDEIDGRAGNDTLHGDDGNDQILGGAGDDILDGGLGQDSLDAGAGQDWIDGGDGNDTITAGTGDDQVLGSEGNDNIALGSGHDIAWGGAGDDSSIGDAGRDVINGGTGRDTLIGGDGQDDLWGDAENDLLIGNADDDALAGGDGRDRLEGEAGQDTLVGGAGQDTLEGGDGDDVLFGNSGNDFIKGGKGDDRIWAGSGDDELFGDDGADVFAFSLTSGDNIVFDFAPGQDRIQIYDRDLQYDYLNLAADGDDTHIDLGATSLRLVGVTHEQISAGDIIFGW
ncbi:MAG: hypothetical protein HRU30_16275, partial [Rhodobacteraceae bacterium]|nr:hypothetical protein [Paracoccaceae bacterium]